MRGTAGGPPRCWTRSTRALAGRRLSELSGGQRQRVAIAEALPPARRSSSSTSRWRRWTCAISEIVQLLDRLNTELGDDLVVATI